MCHSRKVWIVAIAGVGLIARSGWSGDDSPSSTNGRSTAMGEMARAITLVAADRGTKAELIGEPIFRFDDPTRQYSDGTLWAFGRSGRPDALLCLSLEKNTRGEFWWLHELTSLSTGPVSARSHHAYGAWTWDTKEPGVKFQPVPKAAAPGDDEAGRLRQMKEIARRFKAFESLRPDRDDPSDRFELRLLTQPVHRYQDADKGLIDGAIFLITYGRNPEIALMIEAGREGKARPSWSYALAPIAASRLRVSLDDREVADIPKPVDANWQKPYCILVRRAIDMKD
jgi:hypothetical protein